MQRDSAERLDLYGSCLDEALGRLRKRLGDRFHDRPLWRAANKVYARGLPGRPDAELAETFFNSVTRRVFATEGVDPAVEFVHPAATERLPTRFGGVTRVCPRRQDTAGLVARLLDHHRFGCGLRGPGARRHAHRARARREDEPRSKPSRPPGRCSSATRAPTSSGARGAGAAAATRS